MILLTVGDLLEIKDQPMGLKLLAGDAGLGRRISQYRIQKSGLTLTGLYENVHEGRIQLLGQNEMDYLDSLPALRQKEVLKGVAGKGVPCFIVTRGLKPPAALLELAEEEGIPVLQSDEISSAFIIQLHHFLEFNLAASTTVHGVFMDVLGVGVLIIGISGVGKSECALELLLKGHKLVADDVVQVRRAHANVLWGSCSPVVQHHMEVRGLGILNVAALFGVTAVRERKRIEVVLELVEWDGSVEYDRLGLEHKTYTILDIEVPLLTVPVSQGRNTAAIVEVAARNFLLQEKGIDTALSFQKKINADLIRKRLRGNPVDREKN